MKVGLSLSPSSSMSLTRGVGAYTRELLEALKKNYPADQFLPLTKKSKGLDLIHYPYFDPFFLTLPLKRSAKTVVTVHDAIPLKFKDQFPPGVKGSLKLFLQKRALQTVDHVITDSVVSKADLVEYLELKADKITVIPLAPALERSSATLAPKVKSEYRLPKRYILYVGDINWNKNVPGLIRAFGKLESKTTHLVLVGKVFSDQPQIPQYHEVIEAIEDSGKAKLIHQVGYVPQHHLPLFYRLATLYVQPSWYEGFGLPILEAMYQGCPVLTSNRGSLPEVGGESVAYFDPGKPREFVKVLTELLGDSLRRQRLAAAGQTRSKKFSWTKTASQTYEVYQRVLEQA